MIIILVLFLVGVLLILLGVAVGNPVAAIIGFFMAPFFGLATLLMLTIPSLR